MNFGKRGSIVCDAPRENYLVVDGANPLIRFFIRFRSVSVIKPFSNSVWL